MMRFGGTGRHLAIGLAASFGMAGTAQAEPLFAAWQMAPTTPTGDRVVHFSDLALEQRLLPAVAVVLAEDAVTDGGKTVAAGTALFQVFQLDGKKAFCTVKDRSAGNAAKSLFIPALDKRPCFVDSDGDGRFDAAFNVFDKYGSALAPSGDLDKATALASGGGYTVIDSADFPAVFRMTYRLVGKKDVAKAKLEVAFDNGSGRPEVGVARNERDGNVLKVLNATVEFLSVEGDSAAVRIATDDTAYVLGNSGGGFALTATLPPFAGS